MSTAIYSCKKCKVGKRISYPEVQREHLGYGRHLTRHYRVENGARIFPGSVYVRPRTVEGDGACKCGRAMTWGWLQASVVESVKCDARCTGARGFTCDCSCGGKNHGAGWLTQMLVAS